MRKPGLRRKDGPDTIAVRPQRSHDLSRRWLLDDDSSLRHDLGNYVEGALTVGCDCSITDVLRFVTEVSGTQKAKVFVTVKSECQETGDGCQVTYTVTNDASADTNVSSLSVGDHVYIFDDATAKEVLPGQVGTVTVVRPGAECKVTSEGALSIDFPTLGLAGPKYSGICVCTLQKACDRENE